MLSTVLQVHHHVSFRPLPLVVDSTLIHGRTFVQRSIGLEKIVADKRSLIVLKVWFPLFFHSVSTQLFIIFEGANGPVTWIYYRKELPGHRSISVEY